MKNLVPNVVTHSVLNLNSEFFLNRGINAVFLDVDNTLKKHYDKLPGEKIFVWLNQLKQAGIKLCIVSNGHQNRVDVFALKLNVYAIGDALKPSAKGFNQAKQKLNVSSAEACVIGDQIFTDIWGGNRAGITTVLVDRISDSEPWWVKLKRFPEFIIIKLFMKNVEQI